MKVLLFLPVGLALLGLAAGARAAEGPAIEPSAPPATSAAWLRTCSLRHPLCVRAAPRTPPRTILAVLGAADRAWDTLTGALDLPPPSGTDREWDVYVVHGVDGGTDALLEARDPLSRLDRASSFALVDGAVPEGCALDLAVARAVARGAIWNVAPATDEGSARAESQMIARLATPCAGEDEDDRVFQDQPERTVIDPTSAAFDRGASLFFDWLDANFAARLGGLVQGLWALAATTTPPQAARWSASPTGFDVLRISLKDALGADSTFEDVLVRFAVHRALATPAARLAWHVPWPANARRFASPVAVAPTGASYVMVDLAGAPPGATLRVEAAWEDFGRMRWDVVKLDARGRELADVPVTSLPLGTAASMTVEPLDGVDRVLVVGVDVGSTEHPFDPDQGWWEPHGWLLTVEGE